MIGVVILNFNTWKESILCVQSIKEHTTTSCKIYLVDNGSSEKASHEQIMILQKNEVEIIFNKENSGYAAGNNVGLRKAYEDGCDQFLVSNSDVIVTDDSIDKMSRFVKLNPEAGLVGPIIYNSEGIVQPIYMLSKLTAIGKIKNMMLSTPLKPLLRKFEKRFIAKDILEKPTKVFCVSGCCFLFSKVCYEMVFPFDEHTFLYEEEYILGCRLETQRIGAYILPDACIVHAEGVSTEKMSGFSYKCLMDSEQYYMRKYLHTNAIMRWIIKCLRIVNWNLKYKRTRGK